MGEGAGIKTLAGAVDIQEQIIAEGEAVHPGRGVTLLQKLLPFLFVLKNVNVRFARILIFARA